MIKCSITIRSHVKNPEDITTILNVEPTFTRKKGSTRRTGQTPSLENIWSYSCVDNDSGLKQDLLTDLLSIFGKKVDALKEISEHSNISLGWYVEITDGPSGPPIGLDKTAIQFLSRIDACLEFDLYCLE